MILISVLATLFNVLASKALAVKVQDSHLPTGLLIAFFAVDNCLDIDVIFVFHLFFFFFCSGIIKPVKMMVMDMIYSKDCNMMSLH